MALIDTTCPQCGAPHARKLSMIHAEGLSTVQTDIKTVGTYNTIGRQKIKTEGTANGVQQTEASKAAAKPEVPEVFSHGRLMQGIVAFLGVFTIIISLVAGSTGFAVVGVLVALCALLISGDATPEEIEQHKEETREVQERADNWDKTFQCGACGHQFVPPLIGAS